MARRNLLKRGVFVKRNATQLETPLWNIEAKIYKSANGHARTWGLLLINLAREWQTILRLSKPTPDVIERAASGIEKAMVTLCELHPNLSNTDDMHAVLSVCSRLHVEAERKTEPEPESS